MFPAVFYQLGTRLREASSVSGTARMIPQDGDDVTNFSTKNATCIRKIVLKFGSTCQLPWFFFQVPPFNSISLQVIVSLLLFQEGQRLF